MIYVVIGFVSAFSGALAVYYLQMYRDYRRRKEINEFIKEFRKTHHWEAVNVSDR